jgi:hypothetical protein
MAPAASVPFCLNPISHSWNGVYALALVAVDSDAGFQFAYSFTRYWQFVIRLELQLQKGLQ